MRVLVWQWGRRGAGPRFAACLNSGLSGIAGIESVLSLSSQSELLGGPDQPICDLPMSTYDGLGGLLRQWALMPVRVSKLAAQLRKMRVNVALCAMSGPLDLLMAAALRTAGVPFAVVIHDADPHPGDGFPLQMQLQRALVRRAGAVVTLSTHVADRLLTQGLLDKAGHPGKMLIRSRHPPFAFGPPPQPPRAHGGPLRLLLFGRLLPYKGLDLLAETLARLGPRTDMIVRVVGYGPESAPLAALRLLPGVTVENRWVPETELATLLAWCDAMVLPYREASQSGAGAAAVAAGRWVVATRVGGMEEQMRTEKLVQFADPTSESLMAALDAVLLAPPVSESRHGDVSGAWQAMALEIAAGLTHLAALRQAH